ncbi:MAG TPA: hypothetical protein VH092_30975 [Urbifossiella sp.]|jgi:predicted small lipoprotein YifL|nr:hypothetical protein [Urbifossiella sp.]
MRWFAIIAVCALALAGCKKKKPVALPDSAPEPAPAIKKDGLPSESPPAASGGGGGGSGIIAAGGGIGVVNPVAALGGGGGGGAAMAMRKAVRRTQSLNEMNTLGQVIQMILTDEGRMPNRERILTELKQYPQLLTAVSEGSFILTGSAEPGGLWAFEVDADTMPGIALIGGRATRMTPDEMRPYLAALPRPAVQPQPMPPQPPVPMRPGRPMGGIDNQPAPQQPPAAAVAANVTRQDLEEIRIFIDNASGVSGQLPTPQQTLAALKQAGSPQTVDLVEKKAITLTGARAREGIWAYETAALQRGGLVCGSNGTETLTADALRRQLGR